MPLYLVPTDLSPAADHALNAALQLAKGPRDSIHLVHSVDLPDTWQEARFSNAALARRSPQQQEDLYPEVRARVGKARQQLEDLTMRIAKKKVKATYSITGDAAWRDIVQLAHDQKAAMIVMGTHGAGTMKNILVGSNTRRVVRMADVPVLTLHEAMPRPLANIVVVMDPLEPGMDKTIDRLLAALPTEKARIHFLRVNTPTLFQDSYTSMEQLGRIAKRFGPRTLLHTTDHFSVPEGVVAFAAHEGMDLIAMPTHGRKGLRGMLDPSVAEAVVLHAPVPVITVKAS